MTVFYNDNDPGACAWMRELIKRGLIPHGEVDERSILDVRPVDLAGFTSCHFFAGIGGWAYALRLAGWPDDRPVWTGSPPCQPFSAAGKGLSRDDPRHLAPHFVSLVRACRPDVLFGEQVASAEVFGKAASGPAGRATAAPEWAWIDDLSDRLEAAHYAVGASDIPAAGIGAPHIRQRTFFGAVRLADAMHTGRAAWGTSAGNGSATGGRGAVRLADADDAGPQGRAGVPERAGQRASGAGGMAGGLADADAGQQGMVTGSRDGLGGGSSRIAWAGHRSGGDVDRPDPLDGPWRDADWLWCRDGKWRPVEPGLEPLAHGLPARVGRLRGYGNAIVPQAAATFIAAFTEAAGVNE